MPQMLVSKCKKTNPHAKYNEIIELHLKNSKLKFSEVADYIIDLEYDIATNIDPRITLQNINFILACYIWYYVREEEESWEIIKPLSTQQKDTADQQLLKSCHNYKSRRYFQQQLGFYHTVQQIPKSLYIGSNVVIASSFGAFTLCVEGATTLFTNNMQTITKLPVIPLNLCASIIIALLSVPVATLSSVGLYLANGTDLSDAETWQFIGETKTK